MNEKYQKITVGGLLVVDGKILIVRRSEKEDTLKGFYELPGGKVDFGEHPKDSLKREFMEETNLEVEIERPYRIFTYVTHEGNRHTIEIVYITVLNDNIENLKLSGEHDDYKWISIEEVDGFEMSDQIKINIKEGFALLKG